MVGVKRSFLDRITTCFYKIPSIGTAMPHSIVSTMKQFHKRCNMWCLLTLLLICADPICSNIQDSEADANFKTIA